MEGKNIIQDWTVVSEIQLVYKPKVKASIRPVIKQSKDAYELCKHVWNDGTIDLREEFKVMFLNRANKVLGVYHVSCGGLTATVADPKLIFAAALKACAVGIILVHNHPSGNLKASAADEELTQKIVKAANLLDIKLLDHLIITSESYLSFADEGLL